MRVLGLDPTRAGPEVRARLGYAPEHDALWPDVAAHDIVRHLGEVHGLPRRVATARASDALYEVGLGEERFRPTGTMSTGQRQRVKLAQAIVHDPDLVLLDEPTNGLDPVQREHMLALIQHIAHNLGIDVILSSHLLDEVERVADGVVILDEGHTVASGAITDLRQTGEAAQVVVTIDGSPADVARLLLELADREVEAHVVPESTKVVVTIEDDSAYDELRDAIAIESISVRSLVRHARSLEDIFLAAGDVVGEVVGEVVGDVVKVEVEAGNGGGP